MTTEISIASFRPVFAFALALALALALAIVLFLAVNIRLFKRKVEKEIESLARISASNPERPFSYSRIGTYPEPVQRYFRYALKEGQAYIRSASLKQVGAIRRKEGQAWMPLSAEQHFTTGEPAFIWKARVKTGPIWIDARDKYFRGKGNMLIKPFSTITAADAKGPEMDSSSLLRFLSETAWVPTALAEDNVVWEAIDSDSARVIMEDRGMKVSAVLTFNGKGEITKVVTNEKYREVDGEYRLDRWTGHFSDYREFEGIRVPTRALAVWNLESGDLEYAKLQVTDVRYDEL